MKLVPGTLIQNRKKILQRYNIWHFTSRGQRACLNSRITEPLLFPQSYFFFFLFFAVRSASVWEKQPKLENPATSSLIFCFFDIRLNKWSRLTTIYQLIHAWLCIFLKVRAKAQWTREGRGRVLPINGFMGMCRRMILHFHDWFGLKARNLEAFNSGSELGIFWFKNFLIFVLRSRLFSKKKSCRLHTSRSCASDWLYWGCIFNRVPGTVSGVRWQIVGILLVRKF